MQDEIKQLIDEGTDMQACIVGITKRDARAPAMLGVIKHLLMRHSNPDDPFDLPSARLPEPQPGQPPQPSPLLVELAQLGSGINPHNASLNWLFLPALQNFLLHDPIIDANQAFMRLRAQQTIYEKEQEQPGFEWDVQSEAKELARFRGDVQQDVAGPMFAHLMLHLLATLARIPTGYGPLALKRLMSLAVSKATVELMGPQVLPLLLQIMQTSRKQFFQEGGLNCCLKGFADEKQRGRGIWMTMLCSVSPADWVELGTPETVAQTLSEIVVPGLCAGQFEDFFFMYSDPDPLENLGQGVKNGGKSRSSEKSIGSSACGRGFDLFGIMLIERIVLAAQMWAKNNPGKPIPFIQALQMLTQENSPRAVACLMFVADVLLPPPSSSSSPHLTDIPSELAEAQVPLEDPAYPAFVINTFKMWRALTFEEKKPYYMRAFNQKQRSEMELKTYVEPPAPAAAEHKEHKEQKQPKEGKAETAAEETSQSTQTAAPKSDKAADRKSVV